MKIPKRYQLHLAAGPDTDDLRLDVIRVEERSVVATDGVVVASVPIGGAGGVQLESTTEDVPDGTLIRPRAWAAAVKGSQGDGVLRLTSMSQAAAPREDGPVTVFALPPKTNLELPRTAVALRLARQEAEETHNVAEIILDAEALYRLSQALGVREGVRIRFAIDNRGRCVGDVAAVSPAEGGPARGAIMPILREGR